jgi:indolepyruvate ferredoxin oxidoreductase beta subunit
VLSGWPGRAIERLAHKGIVLETTSVRGFLQLYVLAAMRGWRRNSLRFAAEQQRSVNWLAQVAMLAAKDYALAVEIAQSPRLIKGYGATHTLGSRNFDAIMAAIPKMRSRKDAAACARRLREAALSDENGAKLAEALREISA